MERILRPSGATPAAPYTFSLSGVETLLVRVWCGRFGAAPATAEAVTVTCRFVRPDGSWLLMEEPITPTTDRVVNSRFVPLGVGTLQDLTVQWAGAATLSGLCYVAIYIVRGRPPGSTRIVAQLVGGYVYPAQGLAWPGSPIRDSLDGPGFQHLVTGAVPAAGAEASVVQPARAVWAPLSAFATIADDPTGTNRVPSLVIKDGAGGTLVRIGTGNCGGSQTVSNTWARGVTASSSQLAFVQCLPAELMLRDGATLTTLTIALQAADQWTALAAYVTEWLDGTL